MGGLDTERARAYLARMPDESRPKTKRESPQFTGKVIAALYESNLRMELSGRALIGAELGAKLGVSDIDGSAPTSYRYELGGPPGYTRPSHPDGHLYLYRENPCGRKCMVRRTTARG
jgi:hypothetical protein